MLHCRGKKNLHVIRIFRRFNRGRTEDEGKDVAVMFGRSSNKEKLQNFNCDKKKNPQILNFFYSSLGPSSWSLQGGTIDFKKKNQHMTEKERKKNEKQSLQQAAWTSRNAPERRDRAVSEGALVVQKDIKR